MAAYRIGASARRRDLLAALGATGLAGIALAGLARPEHLLPRGAQPRPLLVAKVHGGDNTRATACIGTGA